MQSALRIGRVGPLNIYLHYTWLIAAVIGLWWIALLWLPDNFPTWPGQFYWLAAVAALLLFLASVILHELVHAAFARTTNRTIVLLPTGAAAPFNFRLLEPGRAVVAALAGPIFSLLLGGVLLVAAGAIPHVAGPAGAAKALLSLLGYMNIIFGAVNLIPGIPFDAGWALAAAITIFTEDRESATRVATGIGALAALLLALLGAFVGLTSDAWLPALTLVLIGWAAREAGSLGEHRVLLRGAFAQMHVRHFMDKVAPEATVKSTSNIAEMVRDLPKVPPDAPLPVVDGEGKLLGIVTLSAAEQVLQGTWPVTPVTALMTSIRSVQSLRPGDPLTELLSVVEARRGTTLDEEQIPVVDDGRLIGGVDPTRVQAFERVGQEFAMEETVPVVNDRTGFFRTLAPAILPLMVIAAMAILGSLALRTDPADLRDVTSGDTEARINFTNLTPTDDEIVERGSIQISVDLQSSRAISTATILVDGEPVDTTLSGASPLTQTVQGTINELGLGVHEVTVVAETISGRSKTQSWQFRVSDRGTEQGEPGESFGAISRQPEPGARVLAGGGTVPIVLRIAMPVPPEGAQITLNGEPLETEVEPVAGEEGEYVISANAPQQSPGVQRVSVAVSSPDAVRLLVDWTFSAVLPDENNAYFEQTGHFVGQPFLDYWQANGGLEIFGYPISGVIQESVEGTDDVYRAQYFERARFELHPSTGDQVILGRLGAILNEPEPAVEAVAGARFFPETGHNVSDIFFTYWQEHGGLAIFGYPISEERLERSPLDNKEYRVQYFERNRFEYHPESEGTPFVVQLGQLGSQLFNKTYGQQGAIP